MSSLFWVCIVCQHKTVASSISLFMNSYTLLLSRSETSLMHLCKYALRADSSLQYCHDFLENFLDLIQLTRHLDLVGFFLEEKPQPYLTAEFHKTVLHICSNLGSINSCLTTKYGIVIAQLESNFNPILTSRLVHPYHLDESIPRFGNFWQMFLFLLHFP